MDETHTIAAALPTAENDEQTQFHGRAPRPTAVTALEDLMPRELFIRHCGGPAERALRPRSLGRAVEWSFNRRRSQSQPDARGGLGVGGSQSVRKSSYVRGGRSGGRGGRLDLLSSKYNSKI